MVQLLNKYNVTHWTTAAYHAQANPDERYIKTVSAAIRATIFGPESDHQKWDKKLSEIAWALNNTINQCTGKTQFFINFGREDIRDGDQYQQVEGAGNRTSMSTEELRNKFEEMRSRITNNLHLQRAQDAFRTQYNNHTKQITFEISEKVWRKNHDLSNAALHYAQKLAPKYVAAEVVERLGTDTTK